MFIYNGINSVDFNTMLSSTLKDKIVNAIEQDDLDNYLQHMQGVAWHQEVGQVPNYVYNSSPNKTLYSNRSDSLKVAVHLQADKIFTYLMNQDEVMVNPCRQDYGLPIVQMALYNNRYDYAHAIIHHPTFDLQARHHVNSIALYPISDLQRAKDQNHLQYVLEYMAKMAANDFKNNPGLKFSLLNLLTVNEQLYNLLDSKYKEICQRDEVHYQSLIELYKSDFSIDSLVKKTFKAPFKDFLANKLNEKDIKTILTLACVDSVILDSAFNHNSQEDIKKVLQTLSSGKEELVRFFHHNVHFFTYLNIENLETVIGMGADLFKNEVSQENTPGDNGFSGMEAIVLQDYHSGTPQFAYDVLYYVIEKYRTEIVDKFKENGRNYEIYPTLKAFLDKEHFQDLLPHHEKPTKKHKI